MQNTQQHNIYYDTVSTYVTLTLSLFFNYVPHKHVCQFQVHDTSYVPKIEYEVISPIVIELVFNFQFGARTLKIQNCSHLI